MGFDQNLAAVPAAESGRRREAYTVILTVPLGLCDIFPPATDLGAAGQGWHFCVPCKSNSHYMLGKTLQVDLLTQRSAPEKTDGGLPAKRASRVYASLTRSQAYMLVQLRTGSLRLATFAKLF